MTEAETRAHEHLTTSGYPQNVAFRVMPDGRVAWVHKLMYTGSLLVGQIGDRSGYDDRWCFCDMATAEQALKAWDGAEPEGWHRHPNTGRRRPDGDKEREYVEM
jgi:hypothetical protein